jgi:hypothetical protein
VESVEIVSGNIEFTLDGTPSAPEQTLSGVPAAVVLPENASNKTLTWSLTNITPEGNTGITVNAQTGVITATAPGTARLIATANNAKFDYIDVKVNAPVPNEPAILITGTGITNGAITLNSAPGSIGTVEGTFVNVTATLVNFPEDLPPTFSRQINWTPLATGNTFIAGVQIASGVSGTLGTQNQIRVNNAGRAGTATITATVAGTQLGTWQGDPVTATVVVTVPTVPVTGVTLSEEEF